MELPGFYLFKLASSWQIFGDSSFIYFVNNAHFHNIFDIMSL